jgi:hypothetical protein
MLMIGPLLLLLEDGSEHAEKEKEDEDEDNS